MLVLKCEGSGTFERDLVMSEAHHTGAHALPVSLCSITITHGPGLHVKRCNRLSDLGLLCTSQFRIDRNGDRLFGRPFRFDEISLFVA